jgi:hypothetical protein
VTKARAKISVGLLEVEVMCALGAHDAGVKERSRTGTEGGRSISCVSCDAGSKMRKQAEENESTGASVAP